MMKKVIRLTLLMLFIATVSQLKAQLNIITYNIRYNNPGDGEFAWPERRADVINLLKFHKADIFCLQEALNEQVEQVSDAFPHFEYVGVGRDDGKQAGEYSPVYFNKDRFSNIESGHFWLSENPGVPGLGWDAACIRICTWVILKEKSTNKEFVVLNTHFDHIGVLARKNAADLIIKKISTISGGNPVILCGDFNLPPDSEPVRKLAAFLNDSYAITELPPFDSRSTWSGFTYDDEPGDRIDYIFVSNGISVKRYAALTDSRDRHYFSDHLPVMVEIGF